MHQMTAEKKERFAKYEEKKDTPFAQVGLVLRWRPLRLRSWL